MSDKKELPPVEPMGGIPALPDLAEIVRRTNVITGEPVTLQVPRSAVTGWPRWMQRDTTPT